MKVALKRSVVWLLEVLLEALLLGSLMGVLLSSYIDLLSGATASVLAVPVILFLKGYYLTRAFFAVVFSAEVWRTKLPWVYPAIAATVFVAHMGFAFVQARPDLSREGRSAELPFLIGGACLVFACAFGGNWLLETWTRTGISSSEPLPGGRVADSPGG